MEFKVFSIFIFLIVKCCYGMSTPDSDSYRAAVVEINPNWEILNNTQRTKFNLDQYLNIIQNLSNVDILVFPESTLNNHDTSVEIQNESNPCDNNFLASNDLLKRLSCAAKNSKLYLVINLTERSQCPDSQMIANHDNRKCREDGFSIYNANIVFDRTGTVISHYRKFNLFENVDKPKYPETVTFDTDFGVTFGHFICFDLMFREPALKLVQEMNVTDIIFPNMWFSELPFLTGVQIQQNWAYKNNVNLLAAGANNPTVGSTGTGIYAGQLGPLVSTMTGINENVVYTATVPKRRPGYKLINDETVPNSPKTMEKLLLKRDQLDVYTTREINESLGMFNNKICHNDLCCDFNIEFKYSKPNNKKEHYKFRAAVYHGNRTFDGFANGDVYSCTIFACRNGSLTSCAIRFNDTSVVENSIEFTKIKISGFFKSGHRYFTIPNGVDTSLIPLHPTEFVYDESRTFDLEGSPHQAISIHLTNTRSNLLSFGIYGRDFGNTSSLLSGSIIMVIINLFMRLVIFN